MSQKFSIRLSFSFHAVPGQDFGSQEVRLGVCHISNYSARSLQRHQDGTVVQLLSGRRKGKQDKERERE